MQSKICPIFGYKAITMKITKAKLKQIIKEEIVRVISERMPLRGKQSFDDQSGRPTNSEYDQWTEMAAAVRNLRNRNKEHIFNVIINEESPTPDQISQAAALYKKIYERYGGYARGHVAGGQKIEDLFKQINNPDYPDGNKKFIEHIKQISLWADNPARTDTGEPSFLYQANQ